MPFDLKYLSVRLNVSLLNRHVTTHRSQDWWFNEKEKMVSNMISDVEDLGL